MDRLAVLLRDDEVLIVVVGTPLGALVVLLAPVPTELSDGLYALGRGEALQNAWSELGEGPNLKTT